MKLGLEELAPEVGMGAACAALDIPRSSGYRMRKPPVYGPKRRPQKGPRALTENERNAILNEMTSERFIDSAPRQVVAALAEEGRYLAHWRTFYRVLAKENACRPRRQQRTHPKYKKPELLATAPN